MMATYRTQDKFGGQREPNTKLREFEHLCPACQVKVVVQNRLEEIGRTREILIPGPGEGDEIIWVEEIPECYCPECAGVFNLEVVEEIIARKEEEERKKRREEEGENFNEDVSDLIRLLKQVNSFDKDNKD